MVILPHCTVLSAGYKPLPETIPHMLFVGAVIIGYMVLLLGLAVAAPGMGVTGHIINIVPTNWRDEAHIPAYGMLTWLVIWGLRRRGWPLPYAAPVGVFFTGVFGIWTEVAQGTTPGREASLPDIVHDCMGGLMAAALMWYQQPERSLLKRCLRREGRTRTGGRKESNRHEYGIS
ncbi:MAG: VanZ family protein [Nitrospira sp.]|nr:VanZ family protein [Nitrospira sp.]